MFDRINYHATLDGLNHNFGNVGEIVTEQMYNFGKIEKYNYWKDIVKYNKIDMDDRSVLKNTLEKEIMIIIKNYNDYKQGIPHDEIITNFYNELWKNQILKKKIYTLLIIKLKILLTK